MARAGRSFPIRSHLKPPPVVTQIVSTNIKNIDALIKASIKTIDGLAIASVKTYNGIT